MIYEVTVKWEHKKKEAKFIAPTSSTSPEMAILEVRVLWRDEFLKNVTSVEVTEQELL